MPHGQGTHTWADGRQYVGEFKEGQIHFQTLIGSRGLAALIWNMKSKWK